MRRELELSNQLLRTAQVYEDVLRLQGKAQYIYGWIVTLEGVERTPDTRKEGEKPNATTGY